jgi:chaperonin GroES
MELAYTAETETLADALGISEGDPIVKVKPLGDRIVVRRHEAQEKTSGGILLPDAAKNKPQKGKVLSVGPGRMLKDGTRRALQVKEGDTVLFTTWAGDEFKEGRSRDEILLMREEDVLAVLDD